MRISVVRREESRRVVGLADDGTVLEFTANPKTGTPAPWLTSLALRDSLNVVVHDLDGDKITPGAAFGGRRSRKPAVLVAVLCAALFGGGAGGGGGAVFFLRVI